MKIPKNIILSRTDSIGDMVLSLPVATVLKQNFPDMTIAMMGTGYTKAIVETNPHIDCFIDKEDFLTQTVTINGQAPQAIIHLLPQSQLARRAKELAIPLRIGTTNRLYHWLNCNKLVPLSRRKSGLHEAQLNLQLLIVTPLQKIHVIEDYVKTVNLVHNEDGKKSMLRNLTISEYHQEKSANGA